MVCESLEVDIEDAGAEFVAEEVVVNDNLINTHLPKDLPAFMGAHFDHTESEAAIGA